MIELTHHEIHQIVRRPKGHVIEGDKIGRAHV